MSSITVIIRRTAVAAPALLLTYGVCRFLDGLDGRRGSGVFWNVGHVAFFVAMVLFGVLAVGLRGLLGGRPVATVATVVALAGVACFLWVITGDLFHGFRRAAPMPDALQTAGPMLFPLGMLGFFGLLVAARRLPVWTPLLFGVGTAAISVDLDLLPIAAFVVFCSLLPLRRTSEFADSATPQVRYRPRRELRSR
ncbi:hypothetical protein ACWT_2178 [Actinoplanes sp. SE50]|uniref:hypothetical protein n=1 Tax=unclassified Actinoplanes TaxID=2626549 RepID=UPI00023ECC60|nr:MULTISPECIES: hypothetical protein [unclassified Actinoplanes]AEV83198.1 hypothetical protein ACPL_2303 [Actinoplanes sp. SE50/110]ATO81593.1 hypothetical protein ACWT_2178 [Actinoplanes sp. SE50]SLL99001.1 uncharacterized protein ACSP50_2229 [Actinoplanes sp. SE50/110]